MICNEDWINEKENENMNIPVQTYCDIVARVREIMTVLGIEIWFVYFKEWYRWGEELHSTFHTEKEPCHEAALGDVDRPHIIITVEDTIELFLQSQQFFFSRYDDDYQEKLIEWRTGVVKNT